VTPDLASGPLHYSVDQCIRHQTLLSCISASGDADCPLLLSANRRVLSISDKGVRNKIDLQIEIVQSPHMTRDIFLEYIRDVPIAAVENNRLIPGCLKKQGILFCGNCSCHCTEDVMKELAEHGILPIIYLHILQHTSYVFQALDVLLFGRLKVAKNQLLRDGSLGHDLDHILCIFRAYEPAITSLTVRSSWEKVGFGFERRDGTTYLFLHEDRIRQSRNSPRYGQSIILKRNCHNGGGNNLADGLINVSSVQNIETYCAPD
jgi:hypothetical protein